jgi:hypothetical protein
VRVRFSFIAREAAGASSIRHSLRPPFFEGARLNLANLGRVASRERRLLPRHCERSEAIQTFDAARTGLLRCARNDGRMAVWKMKMNGMLLADRERVPDAVQRASRCSAEPGPRRHRAAPWAPDLQRITSCCAASGELLTRPSSALSTGARGGPAFLSSAGGGRRCCPLRARARGAFPPRSQPWFRRAAARTA